MNEKQPLIPIDFRKRICKYEIVKGINELAINLNITTHDVCARILFDGITAALEDLREKKKKELIQFNIKK